MPTAEEFLSAFNSRGPESEETGTVSAEDFLSEWNREESTYQPPTNPTPLSPERYRRRARLLKIQQKTAAGEKVNLDTLDEELFGSQLTLLGTPADETGFSRLPMPFRRVFGAAASGGALLQNSWNRLTGRGDEADKKRRLLTNLQNYNRELDKDSILGETIGPVVGDVTESLAFGTIASMVGGPAGAGASKTAQAAAATRQLAATSVAFGLDGADRIYTESAELPTRERAMAAGRQFLIDGVVTFVGGKAVQSAGLHHGRYFGSVIGKASQKAAERSGLSRVLGSAMADAGVNGLQGGATYLNELYTGLREFDAVEFLTATGMSAAAGGLAGAATSGAQNVQQSVENVRQSWDRFRTDVSKAVEGARAANEFAETATPEQVEQALSAATAKEFETATGQKGDSIQREAFQEELIALEDLQGELERRGAAEHRSLTQEEQTLQQRRERVEEDAVELERAEASLKEAPGAAEADRVASREQESIQKKRAKLEADEALLGRIENNEQGGAVPRTLKGRQQKAQDLRRSIEVEQAAVRRLEQQLQGRREVPEAVAKRRAEIAKLKEAVEAERKAIQESQEQLNVRRRTTEGETAKQRAYLEGELDRLAALEQKDAADGRTVKPQDEPEPDLSDMIPPDREQTPKSFATRYDDIELALMETGDIVNRTRQGETLDEAGKRDLGKLIDTHVRGQDRRVRLMNKLAKARTPGQLRSVLDSLNTHLHEAERRVAKRDFDDAVKKAKNLRPEHANAVAHAKKEVNQTSTDSLRDAAEAIRTAKYQSDMDDTFLTMQTAKGIEETAGQVVAEIGQARPLVMKADDPIRQAIGPDTPGLEITRAKVTLDSPFFREMAARPEVQLARTSETLRQQVWERLNVEAQSDFDLSNKEVHQGVSSLLESIGLGHDASLDATLMNTVARGRGTPLEAWRNKRRNFDGVNLSRDEATMLFYLGMDPRNATVLENHGFKFPDGREFAGIGERVNNQLLDFIGDEGMQIVDWMFGYGNGPLIDRVNDAKKLLTGRPLTTRKDVVPRVMEDTWDITGENPLKALQNATVTSYRHLRHRGETAKTMTVPEGTTGVFDYFLNHAERMNRVAAFLPAARDVQAVLNRSDVKKAIMAKDGRQGLENLTEAVRIHTVGPRRPTGTEAAIARANAVNAAATLGARLTTMFIQGSSTIASSAWRPGGIRTFLRSLPQIMSRETQARMDAVLGQHSGHYWQRYRSPGFAAEQTGGVYQNRGRFRPLSLAQHALRPLQETERVLNSVIRFGQAEIAAQQEGLTPDMPEWGPWVAREWERATYRGENSSQGLELSGFLRAGRESPALGALVTFQNTASKVYSLLPRATDLMDQGRYKDAIGVLGIVAAAQIPVALIREAMTFGDTDEPFLKAAGKRAIQDVASLHPLGGATLVPFVRGLQGAPNWHSGPALLNNVTSVVTAVAKLGHGLIQQGDEAQDLKGYAEQLWNVTVPLATLNGIPVQGVDDYRKRLKEGTLFPGLRREDTEQQMTWEDTVDALTAGE